MRAPKKNYRKTLLIIRLLVITFIVYSAATPLLVQTIYYVFRKQDVSYAMNYPGFSYFDVARWFQDANGTAFFFSWFFIIMVLFPYVINYIGLPLYKVNFIYKFLLFFSLMLIAGLFLVPWGFVTDFFLSGKYPQKVLLLFLLSVIVCPMVNFVLDEYGEKAGG